MEGGSPDTWVHAVFFSLPTLDEQHLGFPPDFCLREAWGAISEAFPGSWTQVNNNVEI